MNRQLVNLKSNAVCEQVIQVVTSLISATEIPLNQLLHFIATIPREFTDYIGKFTREKEPFLSISIDIIYSAVLTLALTAIVCPCRTIESSSSEMVCSEGRMFCW